MDQVIKGKNIDASKITFAQPKVLDNGAKLVYVGYNGGKFMVQTPWMDLPWQMSTYSEGPYPKHSVTLSFRGMDESKELSDFHKNMLEVEEALINGGVSNSVAWFKKKNLTSDVVKNLFNPVIKVSCDKDTGEPDGKYPPTMRLKVPQRDGVWECKVQSKNGDTFRINDAESGEHLEDIFVKNSKVQFIMQCVGLWVASGNYMCQWKVVRAKVDVPDVSGNATFLPDSDVEDDDDEDEVKTTKSDGPQMLEDSDEESGDEAEEEVVEEEPEVVVEEPKPKKKRVVRKKTA